MKKISLKEIQRTCKDPRDGLDQRLIYRRVGLYFAWLLQYTPVTPNGVTLLSALVAIAGLYMIFTADYISAIIGSLMMHLYITLDHADGSLAKVKNMRSKKGEYYDILNDGLIESLTMFILGAYAYNLKGDSMYLWVTASLLIFYSLSVYNKITFLNVKGLKYNRDFRKSGILKLVYSSYFYPICGLITITAIFNVLHLFALLMAIYLPIKYLILTFLLPNLLDKKMKII